MESRLRQVATEVTRLWQQGIAALFPHSCYQCQQIDFSLCPNCENTVLGISRGGVFSISPPITLAWSAGLYADSTLRRLIHDWKYHGVDVAGELVCEIFSRALQQASNLSNSIELVVPIPLHPWRRAWRGFDQAEILAMSASVSLNKPIIRSLRRHHRWHTQASLTNIQARHKNAATTYQVINPHFIRQKNILLVDDVCTSGATALACAKQLLAAGANSVSLATFLRK